MYLFFANRITLVCALLLATTLSSWQIGRHSVSGEHGLAGAAVVALALIKMRFVVLEFMEVRGTPARCRWLVDGWLAALACALLLSYRQALAA